MFSFFFSWFPQRGGSEWERPTSAQYSDDDGDSAMDVDGISQEYSQGRSHVGTKSRRSPHSPTQHDHHMNGPAHASGSHASARPVKPILFYHRNEPYFEFTNFSPHPVRFDGHIYPTAEHLFQAHKFMTTSPRHAERIRDLPSPRAAREEATRLRRFQRADWFNVNVGIMDAILEAKFMQHPSLRRMLIETRDSDLIEDSPVDSFWGVGHNGQGRNELGKALMRLRDKLMRSAP